MFAFVVVSLSKMRIFPFFCNKVKKGKNYLGQGFDYVQHREVLKAGAIYPSHGLFLGERGASLRR
jgi:hypothetical protein